MNPAFRSPNQWITHLPAALVFGSVVLRAALKYRGSPEMIPVLAVLAAWLVLLVGEPGISRRWPWLFVPYLALQSALTLLLIASPALGGADYSAVLFAILR